MHKTSKVRHLTPDQNPPIAGTTGAMAALCVAEVVAVLAAHRVRCVIAGEPLDTAVATHLPLPLPGQRVLVALAGTDCPLVMAIYPSPDAAAAPTAGAAPIQMHQATGVLRIEAPHIQLAGLASVELRCGTAVLRFSAQGEVALEAEAISQSAIGAYRIEGASIDLN